SAVGFVYLVTATKAGISVLVFMVMQAAMLYFILPKKRYLLGLAPVFVLALNAFISANPMWRIPNLFVGLILYGALAVWAVDGMTFKAPFFGIFVKLGERIGGALLQAGEPVKWAAASKAESLPLLRRVLIGVGLSVPALIFLLVMLSRADAIFSHGVGRLFNAISDAISIRTIGRLWLGGVVGIFMFGIAYGILLGEDKEAAKPESRHIAGDTMIINIVLCSVLAVYTLFVGIQFRYLFAPPDSLPYGLNFVTYARRGFFELLLLTFVNIAFILVAVWLTKTQQNKGAKFTKGLCMYLCGITVVLLVSSFYRMWLYSTDDGLTRMRLMVFGFLFFEMIGLVFTFFYIARPKFNIVLVYCFVALAYYLALNAVPMDRVIAREQVNRYFATGRGGVAYAVSLSPDAAPEIARLLESSAPETQRLAQNYFDRIESGGGWRQWNLSRSIAIRSGQTE
ncbi:MAG: DUF4173 domain-containing protein, partial [Defluviitaleaceae bacterium]|nr:DUF4173 domain-containing protein [Defluviitaleaceae bacterium]